MDCSLPGSSVHGILQARILENTGYWNGLLCPPSGDLPDPGIEPASPALGGRFFTTEPLGKPREILFCFRSRIGILGNLVLPLGDTTVCFGLAMCLH